MSKDKAIKNLEKEVYKLGEEIDGTFGAWIEDIKEEKSFGINEDKKFALASTYKIFILLEVFKKVNQGKFSLDDRIKIEKRRMSPGSGVFQKFKPGIRPTIKDLCKTMICISDNTATDTLLELVGVKDINTTINNLGLSKSHVVFPCREIFLMSAGKAPCFKDKSTEEMIEYWNDLELEEKINEIEETKKEYEDLTPNEVNKISERGRKKLSEKNKDLAIKLLKTLDNKSTPKEMANVLRMLHSGEFINKDISNSVIEIMKEDKWFNHYCEDKSKLPDEIERVSKGGSDNGIAIDCKTLSFSGKPYIINLFYNGIKVDKPEVKNIWSEIDSKVFNYYLFNGS